jgi:integrase
MSVNVRPYKNTRRWLVDVTVRIPDGGELVRDRHVVGGTRAMARGWGLERERVLLDGRGKPKAASPAFDTFAREWLQTYPAAAGNSHTTVRSKRGHVIRHLIPFFGGTALDEIDRKTIESFVAHLYTLRVGKPEGERVRRVGTGERSITPRTVAHVLSTLGRILRSAVEWDVLPNIPKFPRVRVPEQPFAFYDAEEAARLIAATSEIVEQALLMFALHTGCRAGELLAVRVGDIDARLKTVTFSRSSTRGIVRPSTKSGRVRTVPLTDPLLDALRIMRGGRGVRSLDGDELVFAHLDGKPFDLDYLHRLLRRAQRRAGLRAIRWHDLRHSFASILTIHGTPIRQVQAWLGHATLGMTMRYAHLSPGGGREHLAAFDAPAGSAPGVRASSRPGTGHIKATVTGVAE